MVAGLIRLPWAPNTEMSRGSDGGSWQLVDRGEILCYSQRLALNVYIFYAYNLFLLFFPISFSFFSLSVRAEYSLSPLLLLSLLWYYCCIFLVENRSLLTEMADLWRRAVDEKYLQHLQSSQTGTGEEEATRFLQGSERESTLHNVKFVKQEEPVHCTLVAEMADERQIEYHHTHTRTHTHPIANGISFPILFFLI